MFKNIEYDATYPDEYSILNANSKMQTMKSYSKIIRL